MAFLEQFARYEDLIKEKCDKCSKKATYISFGNQRYSFPQFIFWCKKCIDAHDFDDMVTSQVQPSSHDIIEIKDLKK